MSPDWEQTLDEIHRHIRRISCYLLPHLPYAYGSPTDEQAIGKDWQVVGDCLRSVVE